MLVSLLLIITCVSSIKAVLTYIANVVDILDIVMPCCSLPYKQRVEELMSELDVFREEREAMTAKVSELQTALLDHQQVAYTGCAKKCPNLFLSECCQVSTKFDNFWLSDSQDDRIM